MSSDEDSRRRRKKSRKSRSRGCCKSCGKSSCSGCGGGCNNCGKSSCSGCGKKKNKWEDLTDKLNYGGHIWESSDSSSSSCSSSGPDIYCENPKRSRGGGDDDDDDDDGQRGGSRGGRRGERGGRKRRRRSSDKRGYKHRRYADDRQLDLKRTILFLAVLGLSLVLAFWVALGTNQSAAQTCERITDRSDRELCFAKIRPKELEHQIKTFTVVAAVYIVVGLYAGKCLWSPFSAGISLAGLIVLIYAVSLLRHLKSDRLRTSSGWFIGIAIAAIVILGWIGHKLGRGRSGWGSRC